MKTWVFGGLLLFVIAGMVFGVDAPQAAGKVKCRTVLVVCTGKMLSRVCETVPLSEARSIRCKGCTIESKVQCERR